MDPKKLCDKRLPSWLIYNLDFMFGYLFKKAMKQQYSVTVISVKQHTLP